MVPLMSMVSGAILQNTAKLNKSAFGPFLPTRMSAFMAASGGIADAGRTSPKLRA